MKKNYYPGKFIVFEGLDGSGKTTQVKSLGAFLKAKKYNVIFTKEPTKDNVFGRKIESVLNHKIKLSSLQLQINFTKDRDWHLKKIIEPALKEGKVVICDRYFFSTFAYGGIDLSIEKLIKLNDRFLLPDLTIFIDVGPKECIKRILKRRDDSRISFFEKQKKLEKVYQNYKLLNERFPIEFVDGERSKKQVAKDIQKIFDKKFKNNRLKDRVSVL